MLRELLFELSPGDDEVVVFTVAAPGPRRHIAHFDKLPVRYIRWCKPKVIANRRRNVESRAMV